MIIKRLVDLWEFEAVYFIRKCYIQYKYSVLNFSGSEGVGPIKCGERVRKFIQIL